MKIFIICIPFLFFSCSPIQKTPRFGKYFDRGKDYKYEIELKSGSTFSLKLSYQDFKPRCEGEWKMHGKNTIVLLCNNPLTLMEAASSGYLKERRLEVKVINNRKLKLKNVILRFKPEP